VNVGGGTRDEGVAYRPMHISSPYNVNICSDCEEGILERGHESRGVNIM